MAILIDTSVLLAAMFTRDKNHSKGSEAIRSLIGTKDRIVPAPVVHELFQLATVRINYARAIDMVQVVEHGGFDISPLTDIDRLRMMGIMRQYSSSSFDYADTAIMALSERLNITQMYTFDRRDFSVFRPKHCDYLELLP
jgi:predicted nucleic acid-binding protein